MTRVAAHIHNTTLYTAESTSCSSSKSSQALFLFFFNCHATHRALHLFPYTTLFRSASYDTTRGVILFVAGAPTSGTNRITRSEEHTSELQSHHDLVCRPLLEKKKTKIPLDMQITYKQCAKARNSATSSQAQHTPQ